MKNSENLIRQFIQETLLAESQSPLMRAASADLTYRLFEDNYFETG